MKIEVATHYCNNSELQSLLHRLPEAFAAGEGELIYDKRNKLRRFTLSSGLVVVVKAYKQPNLFQRLCYSTFWRNKAVKSFDYGQRLLSMDIDTPEPIAAVTYRKCGLVERYFFASTEDVRPDCFVLRDGKVDNPQKMIEDFAAFLTELHEKGFLHGDTNLSNFLYEQRPDGSYHFAVIDTNRSRFLNRPATRNEACQNMMRLTHERTLLKAIVRSYAEQRHWNPNEAEQTVFELVTRFERKKNFWHRFK